MKEYKEIVRLRQLAGNRNSVIYDIHFCNAGVGIIFYDYDTGKKIVTGYYPTLKSAVLAEIERFEK